MFQLLKEIHKSQKRVCANRKTRRKNPKAQVLSTYVTVVFLIVSVAVAMTVFVRRGLQGRIEDARRFAILQVRNYYVGTYYNGETTIPGNIFGEYEPYYIERATNVYRGTNQKENYIFNGFGGGISDFTHSYNDTGIVNYRQFTKPPICAD